MCAHMSVCEREKKTKKNEIIYCTKLKCSEVDVHICVESQDTVRLLVCAYSGVHILSDFSQMIAAQFQLLQVTRVPVVKKINTH